MYLSRTLCEVLSAMRDADKTKNYSYLPGLIEEAQNMANRMEAKLSQTNDIERIDQKWHDAKEKNKELRKQDKPNRLEEMQELEAFLEDD
ncbi:MAG: hypothetical protein KAV87_65545, partial [Desulfobacteraceae bacterium]|nr:hypothetical protein [Desulfobacteraceae bacterium]